MRDYLVFARVGHGSLHPDWFAGDPSRNWDCCLSWYGEPPEVFGAEYVVTGGFNKFDAFCDFRESFPEQFNYRYIFLLDNDVAFQPGDISRFFSICDEANLYLTQPSLKWGTNINFDVTMHNPACEIRFVSFVEVMAPCFSSKALVDLFPTFRLTASTWGIDYAWAAQLQKKRLITVIDAIQIEHTRAASVENGQFYKMLKNNGIDAVSEYQAIKRDYPSFGGFRTVEGPHRLKWPFPRFIASLIVRLADSIKRKSRRRQQSRQARQSCN